MFSFFIRRRKNLIKWARQRMAYYRAFSLTWPAASVMHPRRHGAVSRVGKKGATKVFKQGSDEDGSYANLSEKKEVFTPTGLVWDTNMAAVLLFWDSSMKDVTPRENSLLLVICWPHTSHTGGPQQTSFPPLGT